MNIEKTAADLNKKIAKITTTLTDGTPLTAQQKQRKEAERAALIQQLASLRNLLKPVGVTKVVHQP